MKKFTFFVVLSCLCITSLSAQREFLSNYGVSANIGLTDIGATGSVSLHKYFNARLGFGIIPYQYKYNPDLKYIKEELDEEVIIPDINLKAKINAPAAHLLFDYSPFKEGLGAFHLTAGLFFGTPNLLHVRGTVDLTELYSLGLDPSLVEVEVGDALIRPDGKGKLNAYLKVNALRPYFGFGWGNAIPRGRVGFRFDIGAMYHGKPKVTSPTLIGSLGNDTDKFIEIMNKVQWWPRLSMQLTFRILNDK